MKTLPLLASGVLVGASVLMLAPEAKANIKDPHDHPDYRVELEPHGVIGFWHRDYGYNYYRYDRYGRRTRYSDFGDPEFGAGFRATIELGDPMFIPKLNNTIGISFGIDMTNCRYCGTYDISIWLPVALQWNFFFNRHWSAFAEPGIALRTVGAFAHNYPDFILELGGRYHFNDNVALTMRIGYPFFTIGASFFVG
jgi:hypothetical protein